MISFRYKSNTKQVKIKSERNLNQRMSPFLQGIFNFRNPIVGFKTANNKYYDTETFYSNKERFYGQVADIIQAKDQLQISFVSDNLNSSSNVRNPAQPLFVQDFQEQTDQSFKIVSDIRSFERRLQDSADLNVLFNIHQIYKNEITQSINMIKSQGKKGSFYLRILPTKSNEVPNYHIYVGRRLIAILNLTRQYRQTILMAMQRYESKARKNESDKHQKQEQKQQQIFKVSYEQQNEAPSFTTYQLQQRLNQEACQDYLQRMYQEKALKKYEYFKLNEKCEENFMEFYRIFCEGAIDNDYQNFKNQVRAKVDNNLQLLLSNVDEMDLSRPISRQQQRKQNLKKSVPSIEIVKVENYFEILDQIKPLLMPQTFSFIKAELLDQNQVICAGFADYLSRKVTKDQLTNILQKAVEKRQKRPVSRCLPRSANRNRQFAYNSQDEILVNPPTNTNQNRAAPPNRLKLGFFQDLQNQPQKQQAQLIKLMGGTTAGSGSGSKQNKIDNKQTPPMFGASKQQSNFSPIKYMSDIESNYKQAWTRLQNKGDNFQPEQYGLLYYYLQTRDDSISNHIQQLQWNQQSSIDKLKNFLQSRMIQLMEQNFSQEQLDVLATHRDSQQINCIYQNFRYQSDLSKFLSSLHLQLSKLYSKSPSISPTHTYQPTAQRLQILTKKSSDSKLLDKSKKSQRKYSDQNQQIQSPKGSSFSHPKTNQVAGIQLQILNQFWRDQLQEMIDHCNFTQQKRQQYLKQAFRQGNPSVYSWINSFVQGKLAILNQSQLKSSLKIHQTQNKQLLKLIPIFNQILKSFVQDKRISDKVRKWCVMQLMQQNMTIIGAFQYYIKIKCVDQFVDSLICAYELDNLEMEHYRGYLKRIEDVLRAMACHDRVSLEIFRLYHKQIQAICELYFVMGDIDQLLDNLDMLHRVETKRRKIKIATLNFSGINTNPFEYYDGSQDLQQISTYMKQILDTEQQNLDFKLSIIDKHYTNNKMSIRFSDKLIQGDHLLNRAEFCKKWRQLYDKQKPQQIQQDSQQIIQANMLFDFYCYLSTIRYAYGLNWTIMDNQDKEFKRSSKVYRIQGIEQIDAGKLKEYLGKRHNRPASKLADKENMIIQYLMRNQLDVFFLQEAGTVSWSQELIHQYGWVKGGDSVIIYKKQKFGGPKLSMYEKYKDKLNFNNDTACYFSDRGYLLLSVHFRSSAQFYLKQAQQMFNVLQQLFDQHPMLKIIIGIDANHFIPGTPNNFLNHVPKTKQQFTTNKMRTYLQVQFKKARELSKTGKDYILTNQVLKEYAIEKINGMAATQKDMLPSNQHPYDHFVVRALI